MRKEIKDMLEGLITSHITRLGVEMEKTGAPRWYEHDRRLALAALDYISSCEETAGDHEIKFSHKYIKLHGQERAVLIGYKIVDKSELSKNFIRYDAMYSIDLIEGVAEDTGFFPIPDGRLLLLHFMGNENIPFTTVRKYNAENMARYIHAVGQEFSILIREQNSGV